MNFIPRYLHNLSLFYSHLPLLFLRSSSVFSSIYIQFSVHSSSEKFNKYTSIVAFDFMFFRGSNHVYFMQKTNSVVILMLR